MEAFPASFFLHPAHNGTMKRILVIGCAGSGKSTLSRRLRDILHLSLIYLDQIWHLPDGSHISPEEFDEQLAEVLDSPCWILDGNYRRNSQKFLTPPAGSWTAITAGLCLSVWNTVIR